jgi:predicted DNA-binding transcriptional regulator AlpA
MEIIDPSIAGRAHGDDGTTQLISARKVQERFAIADRTLDKWLINKSLNFPRPVYINKRKYFRKCEIFEWERQQARAHVGGQVVRPSARWSAR